MCDDSDGSVPSLWGFQLRPKTLGSKNRLSPLCVNSVSTQRNWEIRKKIIHVGHYVLGQFTMPQYITNTAPDDYCLLEARSLLSQTPLQPGTGMWFGLSQSNAPEWNFILQMEAQWVLVWWVDLGIQLLEAAATPPVALEFRVDGPTYMLVPWME